MTVAEADEVVLAAKCAVMRKVLDERQWRVYLGTEALALGYGGIAAVARASGASERTVSAGAEEAADQEAVGALPPGRSRRPGAGRPKAEDAQPALRQALDAVLEDGKRGDPMSEITWSILSLRDIAREMARQGFACGKDAIARLMRAEGWSLQGMAKVLEGKQHPGRDRQFRHIAAMICWFREHGHPVISVDTKKKEPLGAYYRDGRSWRPQGEPVKVRDHDFTGRQTVRIVPYGVYDITANRGFVSVGTSHDTAAFAVSAIRLWWQEDGQFRYPGAARLLVTCDAGGSNGHRCRLWKEELARFADEAGLKISVCHFPPGTSKWNKIEHSLFCHITRTWSARPLMTIDDAVAGIAATVTAQGLKCTAVRDDGDYPEGVTVPGARMRWLEEHVIVRHSPHRDLNYTILPAPRDIPEPQPRPARAGRVPAAVLNHPALTGTAPDDVTALTAALEVPFGARREQHNYTVRARRRGSGGRVRKSGSPNAHTRIGLLDYVLAVRLSSHLNLPDQAIGALLGVDRTTVSHARALAGELLAATAIPLPETAPPLQTPPRTPAELLEYAAAAGITLELPQNGQTMPEHFRTRQRQSIPTRPKPDT
jgi:Rhodopirellula transposase DDE domain